MKEKIKNQFPYAFLPSSKLISSASYHKNVFNFPTFEILHRGDKFFESLPSCGSCSYE